MRTIEFTVNDGSDDSLIATTRVLFDVDPIAPNVVGDSGSGNEDIAITIDVLSNDTDGDTPIDPTTVQIDGTSLPGDPLVVAGEGTWTVNPVTGALTFTGELNYNGTPSPISYSVADTDGIRSVSVPVNLTVNPVNDVPVATGNSVIAAEDVPLVIGPGNFSFTDVYFRFGLE